LNKENVSACISLHSAVTFEEIIFALLSKSDPLFQGIRWFDTAFSTAHLSTLSQHSPYNIYVSRVSKIIVAFLPKTPNSPTRPFCSGFYASYSVFISVCWMSTYLVCSLWFYRAFVIFVIYSSALSFPSFQSQRYSTVVLSCSQTPSSTVERSSTSVQNDDWNYCFVRIFQFSWF